MKDGFQDDGRTIVSMNVEGMPGYRPPAPPEKPREELSRRETRRAVLAALGAALGLVTAISAGLVLFLLFCTEIWFQ